MTLQTIKHTDAALFPPNSNGLDCFYGSRKIIGVDLVGYPTILTNKLILHGEHVINISCTIVFEEFKSYYSLF